MRFIRVFTIAIVALLTIVSLACLFVSVQALDQKWEPTITSTPGEAGKQGLSYNYAITTNESCLYAVILKPEWVSYDIINATFTGIPTVLGIYAFGIKAVSVTGGMTVYQYWNVTVTTLENIISDIEYSIEGFDVAFTYTLPAGSPKSTNVIWSFGDDIGSIESEPRHTYEEAGRYTIKLAVYNNNTLISYNVIPIKVGEVADTDEEQQEKALSMNIILFIIISAIGIFGLMLFMRISEVYYGGYSWLMVIIWIVTFIIILYFVITMQVSK